MIHTRIDPATSSDTEQVSIRMETLTDPQGITEANAQRKQFDRNAQWLEQHASEVYKHRGKYICVASQELFVGDSAVEVVSLAEATHPEDKGRFVRYIPREKLERIYAC